MANLIKDLDDREITNPVEPSVNVWVVDDDAGFREIFSHTVNTDPNLNCSRQFSSAPLLLAALQELPPPDVILLDVQMPEMTGIEALPHIKKLAPATAVLMLSTFFDYTWRQQALAAGAREYYRKTEPADHLKAAIRAAQKNSPPAPRPYPAAGDRLR